MLAAAAAGTPSLQAVVVMSIILPQLEPKQANDVGLSCTNKYLHVVNEFQPVLPSEVDIKCYTEAFCFLSSRVGETVAACLLSGCGESSLIWQLVNLSTQAADSSHNRRLDMCTQAGFKVTEKQTSSGYIGKPLNWAPQLRCATPLLPIVLSVLSSWGGYKEAESSQFLIPVPTMVTATVLNKRTGVVSQRSFAVAALIAMLMFSPVKGMFIAKTSCPASTCMNQMFKMDLGSLSNFVEQAQALSSMTLLHTNVTKHFLGDHKPGVQMTGIMQWQTCAPEQMKASLANTFAESQIWVILHCGDRAVGYLGSYSIKQTNFTEDLYTYANYSFKGSPNVYNVVPSACLTDAPELSSVNPIDVVQVGSWSSSSFQNPGNSRGDALATYYMLGAFLGREFVTGVASDDGWTVLNATELEVAVKSVEGNAAVKAQSGLGAFAHTSFVAQLLQSDASGMSLITFNGNSTDSRVAESVTMNIQELNMLCMQKVVASVTMPSYKVGTATQFGPLVFVAGAAIIAGIAALTLSLTNGARIKKLETAVSALTDMVSELARTTAESFAKVFDALEKTSRRVESLGSSLLYEIRSFQYYQNSINQASNFVLTMSTQNTDMTAYYLQAQSVLTELKQYMSFLVDAAEGRVNYQGEYYSRICEAVATAANVGISELGQPTVFRLVADTGNFDPPTGVKAIVGNNTLVMQFPICKRQVSGNATVISSVPLVATKEGYSFVSQRQQAMCIPTSADNYSLTQSFTGDCLSGLQATSLVAVGTLDQCLDAAVGQHQAVQISQTSKLLLEQELAEGQTNATMVFQVDTCSYLLFGKTIQYGLQPPEISPLYVALGEGESQTWYIDQVPHVLACSVSNIVLAALETGQPQFMYIGKRTLWDKLPELKHVNLQLFEESVINTTTRMEDQIREDGKVVDANFKYLQEQIDQLERPGSDNCGLFNMSDCSNSNTAAYIFFWFLIAVTLIFVMYKVVGAVRSDTKAPSVSNTYITGKPPSGKYSMAFLALCCICTPVSAVAPLVGMPTQAASLITTEGWPLNFTSSYNETSSSGTHYYEGSDHWSCCNMGNQGCCSTTGYAGVAVNYMSIFVVWPVVGCLIWFAMSAIPGGIKLRREMMSHNISPRYYNNVWQGAMVTTAAALGIPSAMACEEPGFSDCTSGQQFSSFILYFNFAAWCIVAAIIIKKAIRAVAIRVFLGSNTKQFWAGAIAAVATLVGKAEAVEDVFHHEGERCSYGRFAGCSGWNTWLLYCSWAVTLLLTFVLMYACYYTFVSWRSTSAERKALLEATLRAENARLTAVRDGDSQLAELAKLVVNMTKANGVKEA